MQFCNFWVQYISQKLSKSLEIQMKKLLFNKNNKENPILFFAYAYPNILYFSRQSLGCCPTTDMQIHPPPPLEVAISK